MYNDNILSIMHIDYTPFIILGFVDKTFLLNLEKDNNNAWEYFFGYFHLI